MRRPSRDFGSRIFTNEQKISSTAGIFEILAHHHVKEENVEEMPLRQELKLNVESCMGNAERG